MFCHNCGKEISSEAEMCPHCQAAIKKTNATYLDKVGYALVIGGAIIIFLKQQIDTMLHGDWSFPGMMQVSGAGGVVIAVGVVLIVKTFIDAKKK